MAVIAVLDVTLLWIPLLNLSWPSTAAELFDWVLAFGFAGAQVFFIDLAVHRYREREREATERRDAASDYNRTAQRDFSRRDFAAVAQPPPDIEEKIRTAHQDQRAAYRLLLATAGVVGIIGVVRVAFLAREYGQSVVAATIFGSVVGLMLGLLILLLGWVACRGNRLGDRQRAGVVVAAHIDRQMQQGGHRVREARTAVDTELIAADWARARAEDDREWVLGQHWQAMLIATSWLGLAEPPVKNTDLVVPRKLAIADAAARQVEAVRRKLVEIDRWLAEKQDVASLAAERPPPVPPLDVAPGTLGLWRTRLGHESESDSPGGVVGLNKLKIESPPAEPRSLLLVLAAVAVAIAFVAASIAPLG